jgi:hypothetical protein
MIGSTTSIGGYPRVMLLFGNGSASEAASLAAILNLRESLGALSAQPVPDMNLHNESHRSAYEMHIEFSKSAVKEVRGTRGIRDLGPSRATPPSITPPEDPAP